MMKAIETRYRGYKFRSRLEARWAVFFETLGYIWEYEPEGFDLGDGVTYLPDFRINARGLVFWCEVKPPRVPVRWDGISAADWDKMIRFATQMPMANHHAKDRELGTVDQSDILPTDQAQCLLLLQGPPAMDSVRPIIPSWYPDDHLRCGILSHSRWLLWGPQYRPILLTDPAYLVDRKLWYDDPPDKILGYFSPPFDAKADYWRGLTLAVNAARSARFEQGAPTW